MTWWSCIGAHSDGDNHDNDDGPDSFGGHDSDAADDNWWLWDIKHEHYYGDDDDADPLGGGDSNAAGDNWWLIYCEITMMIMNTITFTMMMKMLIL